MTTDLINRATEDVGMEDVETMPLERLELPARFDSFQPSRESALDNETMAEHGFPGQRCGAIPEDGADRRLYAGVRCGGAVHEDGRD